MDFNKLLRMGVQKKIISDNQRNELLALSNELSEGTKPASVVVKILYYLGGFIMLCSMVILMSHTIQNSSYRVILGLGSLYAVLFFGVGEFLWKKGEKLPAGLMYFLFVLAFSLIALDIEKMIGFFPHFSDMGKYSNYGEMCRLPMLVLAVLTITINTLLLKFRNKSLLAVANIVCYFAVYMIVIHYLFGEMMWEIKPLNGICLIFSAILCLIAFIKDGKSKADYSKWMYFFSAVGMFSTIAIFMIMYCGIWARLSIFALSIAFCLFGSLIKRKPFTIIGMFGIIEYIVHLETKYIDDTTILTCAALVTGLSILFAGVLFNRCEDKITSFLEKFLPKKLRACLPQNRGIKQI